VSLRPYQKTCLEEIRKAIHGQDKHLLAVLPTGAGKTQVFSHLPEHVGLKPGEKMLVCVHRNELVWQAQQKLQRYNPAHIVDVEKAQYRADDRADIVVASVQTIGRNKKRGDGTWEWCERIQKFDPARFKYIVVDEAHHAIASSYGTVLRYFGCYKPEPEFDEGGSVLLGVTATPNRGDNMGLESLFDSIVYSRDLLEMIKEKWLCDPKAYQVQTHVDISDVDTHHGDFTASQLEKHVNTPERNALVVRKYKELGEGLRALAFTVDIQHSVDLAKAFNDAGIRSFALHSGNAEHAKIGDEDRKKVLQLFREGYYRVVASAGILCLDSQTEILTSAGWVGIDGMTMDHEVANWDWDGSIFFDKPRAIVRRDRMDDERMVSVKTAKNDIRVTEDHRMVWRTGKGCTFKIQHASEIVGKVGQVPVAGTAEPFRLEMPIPPCAELKSGKKRSLQANSYHLRRAGMSYEESYREAERRLAQKQSLRYKAPHELTDAELVFIGLWVGDGTRCELQSGGVEYRICQSEAYPEIIELIDDVVSKIGVDSVRRVKAPPTTGAKTENNSIQWSFPRGTGFGPQNRKGLVHLEPYLDKNGSSYLWGLSREQFLHFLGGFWLADGDHGKATTAPSSFRISNTNKGLLDLLQAIAACRGLHSSITVGGNHLKNPEYKVIYDLWVRPMPMMARSIGVNADCMQFEPEWKPEMVWCVTSATGNIVTRRNGKVAITGNTEGFDDPGATVALMARPTKSGLLYRQMVGRVLRPFPAPEEVAALKAIGKVPAWTKPHAIVLDFCDMAGRHQLNTIPTLFGLKASFDGKGGKMVETVEKMEKTIEQKKLNMSISDLDSVAHLNGIAEKVDLFAKPTIPDIAKQHSDLAWVSSGSNGFQICLPDYVMLRISQNTLGQWEISKSVKGVRSVIETKSDIGRAFAGADRLVPPEARTTLAREALWRNKKPTDPQLKLMWTLGIHRNGFPHFDAYSSVMREKYNSGEASQLISSSPRMGQFRGKR
jgi:superfamily II DNA or RNA helicase